MARDPKRQRIDYAPSPAAAKVLEEVASQPGVKLSKQALIDKLVIWGAWCAKKEQDRPPPLFGTNRARWRA